jgi:hypothetical protein
LPIIIIIIKIKIIKVSVKTGPFPVAYEASSFHPPLQPTPLNLPSTPKA